MANRVSETMNIVTRGRAGKAGMNPFWRLRLICATGYFSQGEGGIYGQGLKKIHRQISAHRLLPSLRRPHGSGVGARTRLLRLALRELRRTDRPGDSRSSTAECGLPRTWAYCYQPGITLGQLICTPAGTRERWRSLFSQGRHFHQIQDPKQDKKRVGIASAPQGTGVPCG